jgi:hypothetical protein
LRKKLFCSKKVTKLGDLTVPGVFRRLLESYPGFFSCGAVGKDGVPRAKVPVPIVILSYSIMLEAAAGFVFHVFLSVFQIYKILVPI